MATFDSSDRLTVDEDTCRAEEGRPVVHLSGTQHLHNKSLRGLRLRRQVATAKSGRSDLDPTSSVDAPQASRTTLIGAELTDEDRAIRWAPRHVLQTLSLREDLAISPDIPVRAAKDFDRLPVPCSSDHCCRPAPTGGGMTRVPEWPDRAKSVPAPTITMGVSTLIGSPNSLGFDGSTRSRRAPPTDRTVRPGRVTSIPGPQRHDRPGRRRRSVTRRTASIAWVTSSRLL